MKTKQWILIFVCVGAAGCATGGGGVPPRALVLGTADRYVAPGDSIEVQLRGGEFLRGRAVDVTDSTLVAETFTLPLREVRRLAVVRLELGSDLDRTSTELGVLFGVAAAVIAATVLVPGLLILAVI